MLSVVTLNVIMLNVIAPFKMLHAMGIIIALLKVYYSEEPSKDKDSSLFCPTVSDK